MKQNLRLGAKASDAGAKNPVTLTAVNSDVSSGSFVINAGLQNASDAVTDWAQNLATVHVYLLGDAQKGNLYNWYAAVAGADFNSLANGANAPDSVCPRGWGLPVYDGEGSWPGLVGSYGFTKTSELLGEPLGLVTVGGYNVNGVPGVSYTSWGWLWSGEKRNNETSRFVFYYNSDSSYGFNMQYAPLDGHGASVRCIFKN